VSSQQAQESELTEAERTEIEKALGSEGVATRAGEDAQMALPADANRREGLTLPSMMNPSMALIANLSLAYFNTETPLQLGAHDPDHTGFNLDQLEWHIEGKVDQYFELQANLVFMESGVELEELYAQTLSMPASLQMRVGQYLLPFGRINQAHPHSRRFSDQNLVIGKFLGSEGARGLGLEISWLAPLPWYAQLQVSVNHPGGLCCGRSFVETVVSTQSEEEHDHEEHTEDAHDEDETGENEEAGHDEQGHVETETGHDGHEHGGSVDIDGLEDFLYTVRLEQFFEAGREWGFLLGTSYMRGENKSGNHKLTHLLGADFLVKYTPKDSKDRFFTSLQLEWMHRQREIPKDLLNDHGGYAELIAGYQYQWEVGARFDWVDGIEDDPLDPHWHEPRSRYSVQATWYPSHFSRMRLQGNYDNPAWLSAPVIGAMLSVEFLVGAHGSHRY